MAKFTVGRKRGVNSPLYWFTLLGFNLAPRPKPEGYVPHLASVYVMCAGEDSAVKVGFSVNPGQRARQLQTGQDRPVRVFWATELEYGEAQELEAQVHAELKRRGVGVAEGEWYYLAPQTVVGVIKGEIKKRGYWAIPDRLYGLDREDALNG